MGRRNASSTTTSATAEVNGTTENQENTVTEVIEETAAEATENTDSAPEATAEASTDNSAAEAQAQANMETFEKAVASAVEARDTSTGVVPEVNISEVNAAYRELDGPKAKGQAKKLVGEGMKNALNAMDLTTARAYMNLQEKLSAQGGGAKSTADKVPTDPTEALAQQFAVLSLAHQNVVVAEGIDTEKLNELIQKLLDDAGTKVSEYITYLVASANVAEGDDEPTEPTVEGYIKNAAKLALGRSAKAGAARAKSTGGGGGENTYDGPRRDVAKHIGEAFADLPSGAFLTIAKIAEHKSDEYTNSDGVFDKPSQGAISARLFPSGEKKCTVEGVVPTTQDGKKGAKKI